MIERSAAKERFAADWVTALLMALGMACGTIAAAYAVFETQDRAKERAGMIEARLDRIENKLDALLQRGR